MVGIITAKDFLTGSYNHVKIAVFNGNSYSDISYENQYSQYVIDIANRLVVSKTPPADACIEVSYFELMDLCDAYMAFLVENPYACCFEFKTNDDTKPELRVLPVGQAHFVLPDLYNFLHGNAVYFPIETYTFKTGNGSFRANPLMADVCCELINYAIYVITDGTASLFCHAGGTLYFNIAPIMKNAYLRPFLKNYLSRYPGMYAKAISIYKKREKEISNVTLPFPTHLRKAESVVCDNEDFYDDEYSILINSIRKAKIDTLNIATGRFSDITKKGDVIRNLFEFAKDPEFLEIANDLYDEVSNYAEKLVQYNYLPDRNRINYLSVSDIMTSKFSAAHRIELRAKTELIRHTVRDFDKRNNHLISWDGTAYVF